MEIFLRVSFHWVLLQLINGFVSTDFNVRPVLGILCPTNCLSCTRLHDSNLLNQLENLF